MTTKEQYQLISSPFLNEGEKSLIKWQCQTQGSFYNALWTAISHADLANLSRLRKGYPEEVQAHHDFQITGILKKKMECITAGKVPAEGVLDGVSITIYQEMTHTTVKMPIADIDTQTIVPERYEFVVRDIEKKHGVVVCNFIRCSFIFQ